LANAHADATSRDRRMKLPAMRFYRSQVDHRWHRTCDSHADATARDCRVYCMLHVSAIVAAKFFS